MFCEKCGSPMKDTDKFCLKCGARAPELPVSETPAAETSEASVPETPAAPEATATAEASVPETPVAPETSGEEGAGAPASETPAAETPAPEASATAETPAPETPAASEASGQENAGPTGTAESPAQETPGTAEAPKVENSAQKAASASWVTSAVSPDKVQEPEKKLDIKKIDIKKPDFKKSGSKAKWVLLAAAAVVVVLVVSIVAAGASLNNAFHKAFSSPEKYYAWVEKQTAKDLASSVAGVYDAYIKDSLNVSDHSSSAEIALEVGEEGSELLSLAGLAGVDLSWLEKLSVSVDSSNKNNMTGVGMSAALNGKQLISGNLLLNMEEPALYLQVPELTKMYLGMEEDALEELLYMDSDDWEEMLESQEATTRVSKALPSSSQVEKLVEKYLNIAFGCVDDVKKKEGKTLKAGGISQKCTLLEATLDAKTMRTISKEVMKELEDDKSFEKMITEAVDAYDGDEDADDVYDAILEEIEYWLEDLEYLAERDDVVMKVWVDGKGVVRGRSIEYQSYYGKQELVMAAPRKGSKVGYEFSMDVDGEDIKLEGSGKISGHKLDGEVSVKYNGASLVDVTMKDFDTNAASKGFLNGSFTIAPASGIGRVLGSVSGVSLLEDMKISLTSKMDKSAIALGMKLYYDEDFMMALSLDYKQGKGEKYSVPKDSNVIFVEDEDDLEDWMDEIDYDEFLDKLEDSDLPSEVTDALEDVEDLMGLLDLYGYGYGYGYDSWYY